MEYERDDDVVELDPSDPRATVCGTCGRGWDDTVSTATTPTPAGRCPFEYEHAETPEREQTCADRLPEHLAGRLGDLVNMVNGVPLEQPSDPDQDAEEYAREMLDNYPLGVSLERVVRVDLSTGGPADWLELFYRAGESEPHRIVYHFADWFDHAERTLEGDDFDVIAAAFGELGEILGGES